MTTIYLIRHSIRMPIEKIKKYNTSQSELIKNEKIILSVEGEERAKILSQEKELQNIDVVYASNCVRTLQTAKYLLEEQDLNVTIDERFDERRVGKKNEDVVKDWFVRQYKEKNYKTIGGESQQEVGDRFEEAFSEVIDKNPNKRIAIFSHGYAITFFLLRYAELLEVTDTALKIKYQDEFLLDGPINAPDVFKLEYEDKKLKSIKHLTFDDLPYRKGVM